MATIELEKFIADLEARKRLMNVFEELESLGRPFYLGGMTAVNCRFGLMRATQDFDIFIKHKDAGLVLSIFRKHGFEGRKKRMADHFSVGFKGLRLDILYTHAFRMTELLEKQAKLENAHIIFLGKNIPALPVEETVITKVLRGEPKDVSDLREILGKTGVDMEYIRARLAEESKEYLLARIEKIMSNTQNI